MPHILKILNHRSFILLTALLFGLILGDRTSYISPASVYVLALVMIFATVDFSFKDFTDVKTSFKILSITFLLNYIVLGGALLLICHLFFGESELWLGCVLLAASPPGPSVVPFSAMMKGNISYGVIGLFGLHLIALVAAPLILLIFSGSIETITTVTIAVLIKTVIIPLIMSLPLRHKKIIDKARKYKGNVINWGFFIIILTIVGQSKKMMFSNPTLVWESIVLFSSTMFVGALVYNIVAIRLNIRPQRGRNWINP